MKEAIEQGRSRQGGRDRRAMAWETALKEFGIRVLQGPNYVIYWGFGLGLLTHNIFAAVNK